MPILALHLLLVACICRQDYDSYVLDTSTASVQYASVYLFEYRSKASEYLYTYRSNGKELKSYCSSWSLTRTHLMNHSNNASKSLLVYHSSLVASLVVS